MRKINPYKPRASFCGTYANRTDPDQAPQNAASAQDLHCLLTESYNETGIKV